MNDILLWMLAKKLLSRAESRYTDRPGCGHANTTDATKGSREN